VVSVARVSFADLPEVAGASYAIEDDAYLHPSASDAERPSVLSRTAFGA